MIGEVSILATLRKLGELLAGIKPGEKSKGEAGSGTQRGKLIVGDIMGWSAAEILISKGIARTGFPYLLREDLFRKW